MSLPILTSKLYIPHSSALIARRRLFEQLTNGLSRKLTLVAAPAGSGKTSLVSAWLREIDLPVAWLSLDGADSEPTRFFNYLVAACRHLEPAIGQSVLDLLQTPQPPPLEAMMTLLIIDITSTTTAQQYLLVLDDYHLIDDISIHEAMKFLLDHQPPRLHLILITREDPPFPLPQWRVRRQMTELRANDLRFTTPEIIEFFNKTTKELSLSPEDVAALERRTEGWVAGLQLAALSLQNLADPTGFIKDFAGDDRYVVDYLITEVLQQQPPHVLDFLEQTSILRRFSATLGEAVTGQSNVAEILTYLEETNLFLVPLDNRREWYRYHHLFGDLLYHRLKQTSPGRIPKLHGLASRWYQAQGLTDDAIYHALAGEDYDYGADRIEQVGLKMIGQARLIQTERWIDSLPDTFIEERPYLSILLAWNSVLNMQPDKAETQLAHVRTGLQKLTSNNNLTLELTCQIAIIQGYISRLRRDLPTSIAHIQQAIESLPEENEFLQCVAHLNLGGNYWVLGNFTAAQAPLRQAVTFLGLADTTYPALVAAGYLTNAFLQRGHLSKAKNLCQHVEQKLTYRRRPPPAIAYVAIEQGALFYEQNDLTAATARLSQAVQLGENLDRIVNIGRALLLLAWIKQVSGQPEEATALLERASANRPPTVAEFEYHQVRLWLAQGNFSAAGEWAKAYGAQRDGEKPWQALDELTFAHVMLADKQVDRALEAVSWSEASAQAAGTTGWIIRSLALKALCYQATNDTKQALHSLRQALEIAEPEGYCRTFIDHGPPMHQLLQQAAAQNIAPAYVSRLLAAFPKSRQAGTSSPPLLRSPAPSPLVEPLNDREISILRLMAAGLSNREIAEELYLATNTVKWYGSQIYGKLGVRKRAEAVDRGHELGIL